MERNPSFLKAKYADLHTSPEVDRVAKRTKAKTGEKVPHKPEARIQNYLDYLKEIIEIEDAREREEKLRKIKQVLYDAYVIKPDDVPESYWENQRRLAREQGHGDIEVTDELRDQQIEVIVADQCSSLDTWVDYLSSGDAPYPDWLKYWSVRSVLGMGEYDKEKHAFTRRSKGTVKPFPDLDREALAYVLDALEKKHKGNRARTYGPLVEDEQRWEDLLQGENFAKLYAWAIEKITPASVEQLAITAGEWIKYPQNSDPTPLVQSLQGHGTGWCTAGESTAQAQLQNGDFYVYYSLNQQGQPTVPRAAIRMEGEQIAEVRGIAAEQNLDPHIGPVVENKLKEFPDGKHYKKKSADMKRLTELEKTTATKTALTRDHLIFLYEINSPIEGFGYQKDPRISELREQRKAAGLLESDQCALFECKPNQIAHRQEDLVRNAIAGIETKAYVGSLFPDIFRTFGDLEHLYTAFPEGRIRRETLAIGGKTASELEKELQKQKMQISSYAKDMLKSKDFVAAAKSEQTVLVRLKVGDLGFSHDPTTDEIYQKIESLGLELCPAEVGPHYRLNYKNQSFNEYLYIGMKQISDSVGVPYVFGLNRRDDGLWLRGPIAGP